MITFDVALKLGRVSNLPTVWTNVIAGIALAGGAVGEIRTIPLIVALSLYYVGGMFLNDAFDADIDARERPERPIPSGQITRNTVFQLGYGMLASGTLLLLWSGMALAGGTGAWPALCGLILAALVIFYNSYHKGNPLSPIIMGLCRIFVYITVGVSIVVPLDTALLTGAGLLLAYLIGLTYVAKQENRGWVENMWPLLFLSAPIVFGFVLIFDRPLVLPFWLILTACLLVVLFFLKRRDPGDISRAVMSLIAGISLLDALLIAGTGEILLALAAVIGFFLTLALQKYVPGT